MSKASEIGDRDIMDVTKVNIKDGKKQFVYDVGDGDPITSEYMNPDAIKAGVIIAWCEAVRQTVAARRDNHAAEQEALRQRRKEREKAERLSNSSLIMPDGSSVNSAVAGLDTHASPQPQQASAIEMDPADPSAYAKSNLAQAQERLHMLQGDAKRILEQIEIKKKAVAKWTAVVEALGPE